MTRLDIKPHYYQKQILKKLIHSEIGLHFTDLLLVGLESEHVNYHIQKLIELDLVFKKDNLYYLTNLGKDYINQLDDKNEVVEKQPKISVLIKPRRFNTDKNTMEYLMYKRLKQPYFGKVGSIGGKVRFGESMEDAAKRELYEETGLITNKLILIEVYRKIRNDEKQNTVQDVIFFIYWGEDISGTLIEKSEIQENFWATAEELYKRDDLFDDFGIQSDDKPFEYSESKGSVEGF
jgi:ADP-ribose pyrophosphatase YjhB (NUDIX family)